MDGGGRQGRRRLQVRQMTAGGDLSSGRQGRLRHNRDSMPRGREGGRAGDDELRRPSDEGRTTGTVSA